ncbi:hypothetical protein OG758_48120 [Streptomyces sp. NBC_01474]|uniref:hypothetical protein n=1 Tax=Streptomyces sp. NBC_01474 TaxID=2903880 RepID=UPI002DDC41C1|nr:hypothetical protein [Streptomyces sp. NBC_01474]WSE01198.1 hypothetical protein OG758_48120 [Streptomyces sp. NBC_01474]
MRNMLSYLAAALPSPTSSQARLLALQCALRADDLGRAELSSGFLRGMCLLGEGMWWRELEEAHWLYRPAPTSVHGATAQLLDATLLSARQGRRSRARAADWALRTASAPALHNRDFDLQLTVIVLAAHASPGAARAAADAGQVARSCGLTGHQLITALTQLATVGVLTAWTLDTTMDDLARQTVRR